LDPASREKPPTGKEKELGLKTWLRGGPKTKTVSETTVALDPKRIAVLPLVSLSPDPNDEYFADGMTEEVISTLSQMDEIEVISRTSAMIYKKFPKPIKELSRELDVGTVLEGSVRKAGNKIRVTIQMIDANKDKPLWANDPERHRTERRRHPQTPAIRNNAR